MACGLVVAMDGMNREGILELIGKLGPAANNVVLKFNDAWDRSDMGAPFFAQLRKDNSPLRLWIDLKLKDIPDTMRRRAENIMAGCGPMFITVMADNSVRAIETAVNATKNSGTMVLAVTVLTSMTEEDCQDIYGASVKAKVLRLARNATLAGAHGIVCSAQELEFLNGYKDEFPGLLKVTPGIRPEWAEVKGDDQKRTKTIKEAVALGARFIVLGRPITKAADPVEAVNRTIDEIVAAEKEMAAYAGK